MCVGIAVPIAIESWSSDMALHGGGVGVVENSGLQGTVLRKTVNNNNE
jgi:hypothetical protein